MIRRRILGGMVDFGLRINGSKFLPEGSFNYVYGIQKNITLTETGSYVGNSMPSYEVVNDEIYYKLGVSGKGKENIAILNFKTYSNNQTVKIKARVNSASPGDFLAFCKLDDNDILHLYKKLSGQSQTFQEISYTVSTAGSHFVKVYYYQDHDANVASTKQYNIDANAGYFKLVPYTYTYTNGYDNPKSHGYTNNNSTYTIFVRSYYDWYVYSKPEWVSSIEYRNSATNGQNTVANVGSSNKVHRGKSELSISVKANHGLARSGDIVLKEVKPRSSNKPEQTITIHISQDTNPKPNDIIVTLDKAEIPREQTSTATGSKSLGVNVKLVGYTDYDVSCTDTNNKLNFTKGALTQLNSTDTNYKDMSVKSGTLTITKKDGTDISNAKINISGTNGYDTTNVQKNIQITSDTLSCYCDCYMFNRCNCDVEQIYYNSVTSGNSYSSCPVDAWSNHQTRRAPNVSCYCDCNSYIKCYKSVGCYGKVYTYDCKCKTVCTTEGKCTSQSDGCNGKCTAYTNCSWESSEATNCTHCGDSTYHCPSNCPGEMKSGYRTHDRYMKPVFTTYVTGGSNNGYPQISFDYYEMSYSFAHTMVLAKHVVGGAMINPYYSDRSGVLWYPNTLEGKTITIHIYTGYQNKFYRMDASMCIDGTVDTDGYLKFSRQIPVSKTELTNEEWLSHTGSGDHSFYCEGNSGVWETWCADCAGDGGYHSCDCQGQGCTCHWHCTSNCEGEYRDRCWPEGAYYNCNCNDNRWCNCEGNCGSYCQTECTSQSQCNGQNCNGKNTQCVCHQVGYNPKCTCYSQCECENYYEPTDNCSSKTYSCTGKYNFKTDSCDPHCKTKSCPSHCTTNNNFTISCPSANESFYTCSSK